MTEPQWREIEVSCAVCGPTPERFLGYRGGTAHRRGLGERSRIVACAECGLIYANPNPRPLAPFAHYHDADEYFRCHDPAATIAGWERRLAVAQRLLGEKGAMLDVGCGRGESLVAATRAGWRAVGVEPSKEFAEYGRTQYGVDVRPVELSDAHFLDGGFDYVNLSAVLEHVYEPLELLREIRRVLRPGGVLFVGVPNEGGLYWIVGNLYEKLRGRDAVINVSPTFEPYHTLGWSRRSLAKALSLTGFTVERMFTTADRPFYAIVRRRASLYERAAELVDLMGKRLGMGSQLGAWARAA